MEAKRMSQPPPTQAEIEKAVQILREDAILAHNQEMIKRMDAMEKRLERMPVTEMTAEEKAAAYDKLMAEKNQPPTDPPKDPPKDPKNGPVPPNPRPEVPPAPKRDPFWGDRLNG